MNIFKFTHQISIRTRDISRRIQRAINELSENIQREIQQNRHQRSPQQSQHQPSYVPVPVPVNQRKGSNPFIRQFSTSARRNFTYSQTWNYKFQPKFKQKFYKTTIKNLKFYKKSKILSLLNHGIIYHNFSQIYQSKFSLKIYQQNVKQTYKILFNNLREKYQLYKKDNTFLNNTPSNINSKLLLNLSLNSKNHQIITSLAKIESSATNHELVNNNNINTSCFIDFPISFNFNIPNETILSEEIFDEMMFNIKNFEAKLKNFKSDLVNLFDLGELPLKYIQSLNVIRIHFPNCDKERLERLCMEKGISGGIIIEEEDSLNVVKATQEPISNLEDVDILSSFNEEYSCTSDADILSTNSSDELRDHLNEVVRPINEFMPVQQMISINDGDDYHWVSSS
ncbi:uncharacterized protein KGF55_004770 [Candida pseudojiufengensis]|uniref:uncharacterized protein n=1 Tax=Candida pseudojiufengensis TaxID=497109 RepID=UPI0022254E32|nr:uncharacterized protein KGF55_004770 [Candida pseudojiufengensis]KAI5960047.1 hypothetical protein KGF55_004770 [Candida pseudojiufengensis]